MSFLLKMLGLAAGGLSRYMSGPPSPSGNAAVLAHGSNPHFRWVAVRPHHLNDAEAAFPGSTRGSEFFGHMEKLWGRDPRAARELEPYADELLGVHEHFKPSGGCCILLLPPG